MSFSKALPFWNLGVLRQQVSAFQRFATLAGCAALTSACAAAAPSIKPPVPPRASAPGPAPLSAKERLLSGLRGIERPAPVLDVLPKAAHTVLETRLGTLTSEQREQVLYGDLARALPLLHLKAGGSSGAALLTLASTSAAIQELPAVFESSPQSSDDERQRSIQLAHDLVERAAQHYLRDRALDLANAKTQDLPVLLAAIERAAIAAERPDLVRLALETGATVSSDTDLLARLAAACAFDRDASCFARASAGVPESAPQRPHLLRLEGALRNLGAAEPIAKAWALLRISRYVDAERVLASTRAQANSDLRVAAAFAVAASEGTACPGLQPEVGSPRLCADAVRTRPGLAAALADMELAWRTGVGRDADSTEVYVGLSRVVPWISSLATAADPARLERDFSERYQAFSAALQELPAQRPLAVFADALAAGFTAGLHTPHGSRPQISADRKQELWFGALGVDAPAARLAVGAVLAADQSVLQLLPRSVSPELSKARAGLLAWEAVGSAESDALEAARSALVEQFSQAPKGSTPSAEAVLLLAELEAISRPSERTHQALAQVASQLIGQALPPDLALRGVLDAAGALERLGRTSDALGVLSKAAEIEAMPGPAADLLTLIRVEKLVLQWDDRKDPHRVALAKALSALSLERAPASIAFVVSAYASPQVLRQGQKSPRVVLAERLGLRAAELMAQGALRGTRLSLRFSYAFQSGVTPEVTFDPMFVPLVRPALIQKAL